MTRPNNRVRQPGEGNALPFVVLAGAASVAVGAVFLAVTLGRWIDGEEPLHLNPLELLGALGRGQVAWPPAATWVVAALVVVLFALVLFVAAAVGRRRRRRTRVDGVSRHLGTGRDISTLTAAAVTAKAAQLGVISTEPSPASSTRAPGADRHGGKDGEAGAAGDRRSWAPRFLRPLRAETQRPAAGRDRAAAGRRRAAGTVPGVPVGRTVSSRSMLYGSFEDTHLDIWGPRTGKTTSRAIPAILTAPGAVVATSNKRDLLDATRDVREPRGPVWVFDPQGVADQEPTWWWNPLSYVTDEVKAAKLAGHFAAGSRPPGARTDAYFDPAGQDLLAALLLAAALDGRPITQVYTWLTLPKRDEAVGILQRGGFALTADQLAGVIAAPDKQRGGIYGTAQQMASCLTNRAVTRWVTQAGRPGAQHGITHQPRREFDPAAFVTSAGTLYSLSREGQGTAGPLVTALTVAVVEAAEELATRSPGGRLPTPMLCVLDEAANVCRWRELPDLYSHYGSRGILPMTILQSWSQGVEVWGASGMNKLWSAANVKVYGGGVSEVQFLEHLAQVLGDYERVTSSTSTGQGRRSVSKQVQRSRILEVADLAALPRGRAVVIASGARPTLVETVPWMAGPHAAAVRASIAAHDPGARARASVHRDATMLTAALDPRTCDPVAPLDERTQITPASHWPRP